MSSVTKITGADPRGVIKPQKDAPNTRVVPGISMEVELFKSPKLYTDIRIPVNIVWDFYSSHGLKCIKVGCSSKGNI